MTHNALRELLGAYALGAIAPGEREEVDAHLRTCAQCRAEVAALTGVSDQLALLAIERDPPPALRGRLLALIEQDRAEWERARTSGAPAASVEDRGTAMMARQFATTERGSFPERQESGSPWKRLIGRMRHSPRLALGAAGVVAAALIVLGVLLFNRNNVNTLHTYACSPAQQTPIDGNDYTPTTCTLSVRSDRRVVVAFSNLPVLSRTQAYELWMLTAGGRPVRVAGFVPNGDQTYYSIYGYKIDPSKYAKAAVTIERAPGDSPVPRGPIVLVIPLTHPVKVQS